MATVTLPASLIQNQAVLRSAGVRMTRRELERYRKVFGLADALDRYIKALSEEEGGFFLELVNDGVHPDDLVESYRPARR